MGDKWETPRPPDDLDTVYTRNHRSNGVWTWTRGTGPEESHWWTCSNSVIGYRSFAELLNFYGPAYRDAADVPIKKG